ncbi:hypothetical protein D0T53_12495 [Dysgonomonas sp. 216]|uniref:winged helix-turn-helix domain-containing protein n=1 Tax=Dysgonomonas sp. 216 TaxID=2302934 RepID=UPI0013D79BB5|nr:winged helix-turn-helix domain-containing protein [Dysgonomonas sp. 216]NDW19723.1 hypothetical protein [Dysgonomonas sp. 216]
MLKQDIELNAWTIWVLLSRNGKLNIKELSEQTNCSEAFIYMTLGWMLKNNAITLSLDNEILYTQLKDSQQQEIMSV